MTRLAAITGHLGGLLLAASLAGAADHPTWRVGTAQAKITPTNLLWMAGFAARTRPAEGTLDDLWARVLVMEAPDGGVGVLVTVDLVGIPKWLYEDLCGELARRHGLSRSQIRLAPSHTHSGPVLREALPDIYPLEEAQRKLVADYSAWIEPVLLETITQAFTNRSPATLWAAEGRAAIAVNRRTNNENDLVALLQRGESPKGPSDFTVPVLAVRSPDGQLRAVVFGYAAHTSALTDNYRWSADYAGVTRRVLEERHPGLTAMFWQGCGSDQSAAPRGTVERCQTLGETLAAAVTAALEQPMRPVAPTFRAAFEFVALDFGAQPTSVELETLGQGTDYRARWARRLAGELAAGKAFARGYPDYPVQVWRLGADQLWIALGGEVCVDYALRFSAQFKPSCWVTGYANDVMAYIPSRRLWEEGGYQAGAFEVYGLPANRWCADIEDRIAGAVTRLVAQVQTPGGATPSASEPFISLGQPCRAKQVLGGTVVRDRATGRELLALANMNEVSGCELILIDFEEGKGEVFRAPAGAGSWNVREVSNDRLVLGTFYDGTFLIFDLKTKRFVHHVRFAKEEYLWNTTLGRDGRVYAGTYPGGRLGALDLNTYEVEDCGAPAPPNLYLNYVSPTPDTRLLCTFSTTRPIQKLYDPATKEWSDLPESIKGITIGTVFDGHFIAGGRVFAGKEFKTVPPPFPIPGEGWQVETALTTEDTLFLRLNHAIFRYRKGEAALTKLCDIDLRGGRYLAATPAGDLLGIRGQDYFRIRPGATQLELKPIPTESGPRNLLFLRVDPKGRIWSGPPFGQTLSILDPRSREFTNTRTVCDAGGEVFDVAFADHLAYAVTYSGGDIVAYDPDAPWDQWNGKNPRTIASLGSRGYVRPVGGALMGPSGKLYSGWMAKYGVYGGAIGITDLASGQTELIENPLAEQTISSLATDGRLLYIGTDRSANGLPVKPNDSARFGVVDPSTKKATSAYTFTNATRVTGVVFDAKTGGVALAVDGRLYRFDPAHPADPLPDPSAPRLGSRTIAAPGHGTLFYGSGKNVVAWNLTDGQVRTLATLPRNVENIAIDQNGTVFVSGGPDVYQVKSAAEAAPTESKPATP